MLQAKKLGYMASISGRIQRCSERNTSRYTRITETAFPAALADVLTHHSQLEPHFWLFTSSDLIDKLTGWTVMMSRFAKICVLQLYVLKGMISLPAEALSHPYHINIDKDRRPPA